MSVSCCSPRSAPVSWGAVCAGDGQWQWRFHGQHGVHFQHLRALELFSFGITWADRYDTLIYSILLTTERPLL